MQSNPFRGDIKCLKGQPEAWRRRVGNYRILYDLDIEKRHVFILAIVRRTSATY
jgi:mRNA-degrading endonuclease RelE of RelBE toxin-antitoxin system